MATPPALYATDVAFVAFDRAESVYLLFRNRAERGTLARSYAGWRRDGGAWRPLLSITDTLATPRAAWRVLPGPDLRVLAGPSGQIAGLRVGPSGGELRLRSDSLLFGWSGPTGQPERLGLGWVSDPAGRRAAGLVLERRSALPLESPRTRALEMTLLLVDGRGNGFLLSRRVPGVSGALRVDSAAAARGWVGGATVRWSGAELVREGAGGDGSVRWRLRTPGRSIEGELLLRRDPTVATSLYDVTGRLRLDGGEREVRGLAVRTRRP